MTASQQHIHPAVTAALHKALYRIPEAMELLSLSRTVIYEQIRAGRLRTVTEGRAAAQLRLVDVVVRCPAWRRSPT
jgi:hypothetical protein